MLIRLLNFLFFYYNYYNTLTLKFKQRNLTRNSFNWICCIFYLTVWFFFLISFEIPDQNIYIFKFFNNIWKYYDISKTYSDCMWSSFCLFDKKNKSLWDVNSMEFTIPIIFQWIVSKSCLLGNDNLIIDTLNLSIDKYLTQDFEIPVTPENIPEITGKNMLTEEVAEESGLTIFNHVYYASRDAINSQVVWAESLWPEESEIRGEKYSQYLMYKWPSISRPSRHLYHWIYNLGVDYYTYNTFSETRLYNQDWFYSKFYSVNFPFHLTLRWTDWYDPKEINSVVHAYDIQNMFDWLLLWKPVDIDLERWLKFMFPGRKEFPATSCRFYDYIDCYPYEQLSYLYWDRHWQYLFVPEIFKRYWLVSPTYCKDVFGQPLWERLYFSFLFDLCEYNNHTYNYKDANEKEFFNIYKKYLLPPIDSMAFIQFFPFVEANIRDENLYFEWASTYFFARTNKFNAVFFNNTCDIFSIDKVKYFFNFYNLTLLFSIDSLSMLFILLITLLFPLCFLFATKKIKYKFNTFITLLICLQIQLFLVFSVIDIFYFYIFFESVLIPMFLIIGIWGSRKRKIHATFMFFFYTFIGSLFMLFGLFIIYSNLNTTNLLVIMNYDFTENRSKFLWILFFIAFCIKIPMFPFHIWLPEAHVEAPTIGSVLLAGILLKLGTYGLLRYCILLFPYATYYYMPLIYTLSFLAIFYGTFTTVRQIDLKKIIAYASIAHMNYVVLGIVSITNYGLAGSIFLMISHGFVSSGLFFLIGFLYDRYKTRILSYYGGLSYLMPNFTIFFLLFILANISFPGTSNFIGEFLVLLGLYHDSKFITFLSTSLIIFSAVYSIWLCNRLLFGDTNKSISTYSDLVKFELYIMLYLSFFVIFLGLYPNFFLHKIELFIYNFMEFRN